MLNELSLFSGYGGMTLGLRLAGLEVRTIGYVEIEPYCQELLRRRIRDGVLSWAPVVTDITSADFRPMAGLVDIITAGFPCPEYSRARHRTVESGLWDHTARAINEIKPTTVILENVDRVCQGAQAKAPIFISELADIGYDSIWHLLPAFSVGAPHRRWRWLLVAYPNSRRYGVPEGEVQTRGDSNIYGDWWSTQSEPPRVDDGSSYRLERLKALGNGVVPAVVARFLRGIR